MPDWNEPSYGQSAPRYGEELDSHEGYGSYPSTPQYGQSAPRYGQELGGWEGYAPPRSKPPRRKFSQQVIFNVAFIAGLHLAVFGALDAVIGHQISSFNVKLPGIAVSTSNVGLAVMAGGVLMACTVVFAVAKSRQSERSRNQGESTRPVILVPYQPLTNTSPPPPVTSPSPANSQGITWQGIAVESGPLLFSCS